MRLYVVLLMESITDDAWDCLNLDMIGCTLPFVPFLSSYLTTKRQHQPQFFSTGSEELLVSGLLHQVFPDKIGLERGCTIYFSNGIGRRKSKDQLYSLKCHRRRSPARPRATKAKVAWLVLPSSTLPSANQKSATKNVKSHVLSLNWGSFVSKWDPRASWRSLPNLSVSVGYWFLVWLIKGFVWNNFLIHLCAWFVDLSLLANHRFL